VIYIANDAGSAELSPLFQGKAPYTIQEMKAGDFAFSGHGPSGLVSVGVERKTLGDLIGSMQSGRLTSHQLPTMAEYYDYSFLLVEGGFRANPETGLLEEFRKGGWENPRGGGTRGLTFQTIDHFLTTISLHGVRILRATSYTQTVQTVVSLYDYFQTPWEKHKSFKAFHNPPPPVPILYRVTEKDSDDIWQHWVCRLVVKELPGIGWEKSLGVADKFKTVRAAIMAPPEQWKTIEGIGTGIARRLDRALGGKK
jgi:ERCC4-type nuclease